MYKSQWCHYNSHLRNTKTRNTGSNTKTRIAELERENVLLRQRISLPFANQSTQPSQSEISKSCDISSIPSAQWDPDEELGSMFLETNFLSTGNVSGYSSLDSGSADDLPGRQMTNNLITGKDHESRQVGAYDTPPAPSMEPKERPREILPYSINTRPAIPRSATNALHLATVSGNVKCVEILLEHGFKVDSVDDNGQTALMLAASFDNAELIGVLLDRGADSFICAPDGHTALEIAAQLGNANALSVLLASIPAVNGTCIPENK